MKKLTLLLAVLIPLIVFPQAPVIIELQLKGKVNRNISMNLSEGALVNLISIVNEPDGSQKARIIVNNDIESVTLENLSRISFEVTNLQNFWQIKAIENDVYSSLSKNGFQYRLRKDIEEEAIDALQYLDNNNLLINDRYLESYIYSLIHRLYPYRLNDGRPGILNVHISKSLEPDASVYPNGTMLITTGLLSSINSEEELMAVLAHEIAHFVLDHTIININKAVQRQKRAEFWAGVITGLAAATDVYMASQNEYHIPGGMTMGTAVLSYSVASAIAERLGMNYSREQEIMADACATDLLSFIGVDPTALSSTLTKIREYCRQTGNYLALSGEGSHPALNDRIQAIGTPSDFINVDYDKKMSAINSYNARAQFNNSHFAACTAMINRNIRAKVATEEDYVLLSMVTLCMHDNDVRNLEALEYINAAKALNVYPVIDIPKQEAIVLIRLGRMNDAQNSLLRYKENVESKIKDLDRVLNQNEWSYLNDYYNKEYEWTAIMLQKVTNL